MTGSRLAQIVSRYRRLKVVVAGDFCLDRYLHVDPALEEVSIETRLPAHQVVKVRAQPGGAGTVLANVAALRPAELRAVGVCGLDGEGVELVAALRGLGVDLGGFIPTPARMTFTYTKPLRVRPHRPPRELSRLDIRDRTPPPPALVRRIMKNLRRAMLGADAVILLEQAPDAACGVLSPVVKIGVAKLARTMRNRPPVMIADSRCNVLEFQGVDVKVNRRELRRCLGTGGDAGTLARRLARRLGQRVFVTCGRDGMLSADPAGRVCRCPGVRVEGPIDPVGAGDAVMAHLAMALAAGATQAEAIELANLAGAIVVHKIGTTGTATAAELTAAARALTASIGTGRRSTRRVSGASAGRRAGGASAPRSGTGPGAAGRAAGGRKRRRR